MSMRVDYSGLQGLMGEGRAQAEQGPARGARGGWLGRGARRVLGWALAVVALATLPFFLLVRLGVFAYREWGLGTWPSFAIGVAAAAVLLAGYAWVVGRRLGAGKGVSRLLGRGAVGLVVAYAAYGLVYVAGANVKSDDVRAEYATLHPMLRVATSIVFLVDAGSVMTDAGRTPEDYWL